MDGPGLDGDAPRPLPAFETKRLRAAPATRADAAAIQSCFAGAPDYFTRTEGAPAAPGAAKALLEDAEADALRAVFVLVPRSSGNAIGVLDLHLGNPEPDAAHVGLLLFREAFQGRGFGREVIEALERVLADAGYASLSLSVGDENPEARGFWEHLGFAEAGRLDRGVTVYSKLIR